MTTFFEGFPVFNKKTNNENEAHDREDLNDEEKTPDRLINYAELMIKTLCKNFEVNGAEKIDEFKREHPEDKLIITGSHMNNLDVPAAIKTFKNFNLQITGNELFDAELKYLPQKIGIKTLFKDRFTRLGQKSEGKSESGIFRPENFDELDEKMEAGRTPWMAAHSFSLDGTMRKVDNGALVEAYRQDAWLIPTALELTSGSKNMQGLGEIAKNLKDSGATYHVGQPYKPAPLPNGLNINILTDTISKRKNGEEISDEDFESFKEVNHFLSEQTEFLGKTIAAMLPEEQRGYYQDNK